MPTPVAGIRAVKLRGPKTWMAGSSPAMTVFCINGSSGTLNRPALYSHTTPAGDASQIFCAHGRLHPTPHGVPFTSRI
jgi:hypothetical protein